MTEGIGKGLYEISNARTAEQAKLMEDAARENKCVFCEVDLTVNKPLNRLGELDPEGKDWPLLWVWESPFLEENEEHHIMIFPKKHIDNLNFNEEMTEEMWLQILDARKWACKFYNIPGGGGADRFGERIRNAGTIDHWHYQIIVPNKKGNVKLTLFKDLSPIEQARRANRSIYSKKNLTTFDGFMVLSGGFVLNERFHWESFRGDYRNSFAHTAKALPHIRAIFRGKEIKPDGILPVTFEAGYGIRNPQSFTARVFDFKGCLDEASNLNKKVCLSETDTGYVFENEYGEFLTEKFTWEKRRPGHNPFVHCEQTRDYILAALEHEIQRVYSSTHNIEKMLTENASEASPL